MLRMYAAWIEGATEVDIQAIRNAMDGRPKVSLLPFALESPRASACQIVLRPLASPDSASSPEGKKLRVEKAQKKVAERVGLLGCASPLRGRPSGRYPRFVAAAVSYSLPKVIYVTTGGEGGIRTHVPELPDHPISSRRRYDHFGTSPLTYGSIALT
jgi:hypothetical protein